VRHVIEKNKIIEKLKFPYFKTILTFLESPASTSWRGSIFHLIKQYFDD
jgi:hypothetical protein